MHEREDMTKDDVQVPWYSQHFSPDVEWAEYLPGEGPEYWGQCCCGIACLQSAFAFFRIDVPPLTDLLAEGLREGAYSRHGWIHEGLARMARTRGLRARLGEFSSVEDLDERFLAGELLIVSAAYMFPTDGRVGGHLVVYGGRSRSGPRAGSVMFMDPSVWGETHSSVDAERFMASCTGRMITLASSDADVVRVR